MSETPEPAMSGALSVLACQVAIPETTGAEARDAHLERLAALVRAALREAPADLVALPELASIDYSRAAFARLDALAEDLHGPSYESWARVAEETGAHVAYGFPRRVADGFRISVGVVAPDGRLLGWYDKLHLAQYGASMEKEYFGRGAHLCVVDVAGFRIAPIICYDIRIPELSRTLALDHGADLILHCGAYYRDPSFYSWHDFAVTRALENQVYLLSLNRAGAGFGGSVFCPPWIDETCEPLRLPEHDERLQRLTLTTAAITEARETYSFREDRLESYRLPLVGLR